MTGPDPGASGRARAFVALAVDPPLAERVLARVERALGAGEAQRHFRLPRAGGVHLTLFFLGSVERERLARVEGELRSALDGQGPPRLALTGTGAFPARGRERVLWIGVQEAPPGARLAACRSAVLAALRGSGFDTREEEREPFRPHVTVARRREARVRVPDEFYGLALDEPWTPREVMLLESHLGSGPARHEALARIELVEN